MSIPAAHEPADPHGDFEYGGSELEGLAGMSRYYRWILAHFRTFLHGRVIEYGAGIGTFSELMRPMAESMVLVEPDARMAEILRRKFAQDHAIEVASVTLENHVAGVPQGLADTVVLVNVLEHIEDDAQAVLGLARSLKPGGHLAIFVPALPFLMSALDHKIGHFRRYRKPELRHLMDLAQLELLELRYFDVLGVLPWLVLNRVMGATEVNPKAAAIYDRWFVGPGRAIESLVTPPLGKNLIAIARRRG